MRLLVRPARLEESTQFLLIDASGKGIPSGVAKRAEPHLGDVSVPQCDQVSFVSPRRERLAKVSFQIDAEGDALSNEKLKYVFQEDAKSAPRWVT